MEYQTSHVCSKPGDSAFPFLPELSDGIDSQTLSADQQSRFDRPSWHLLQSQLRWALPALASQVVFLEPPWRGPRGLLARTWTPLDGVLFAGSTAVGVLLTLSMQWLLGRTSALSYQVLGHVKTCASLVACALLLDQPLA